MGTSIQKRKKKKVLDGGSRKRNDSSSVSNKKPVVPAPKTIIAAPPAIVHTRKVKHHPFHVRAFRYVEPLWLGRDGKISLRSILAMILTWKLVENFDFAVQKWEAGRSISDVVGGMWVIAALIAGLLSITMYQNVQTDKMYAELQAPPSAPSITVQKAENVTGGQTIAEAGTVNTENIENVNMQKGSVEGG